ncbi:integrase core domain-containing protein, partial [Streptomyces bottropensis]|uniref:integrase core domain-containing protein n=1 Tax=Streptomyces bottropensis TaxID=42235 RepID=UPI0037F36E45
RKPHHTGDETDGSTARIHRQRGERAHSTVNANALMESQIGLYKMELIKPRKPWHGLADVELATAEWVDWFNNQRLHTAIGDIPPHEHETNYYAQHQTQPAAGADA